MQSVPQPVRTSGGTGQRSVGGHRLSTTTSGTTGSRSFHDVPRHPFECARRRAVGRAERRPGRIQRRGIRLRHSWRVVAEGISRAGRSSTPGADQPDQSAPSRRSLSLEWTRFHVKRTQNGSGRAAGSARGCMVMTWVLLGFWGFVIGERSRKHAIARLGPRRPALALGGRWRRTGDWW